MQTAMHSEELQRSRLPQLRNSLEETKRCKTAMVNSVRNVLTNIEGYLMGQLDANLSSDAFKTELLDFLKLVNISGLSPELQRHVLKGEMVDFAERYLQDNLSDAFENKRAELQAVLWHWAGYLEARDTELNYLLFGDTPRARGTDDDVGDIAQVLEHLQLLPRLRGLDAGGLGLFKRLPKVVRRTFKHRFQRSPSDLELKSREARRFLQWINLSSTRKHIIRQVFPARTLSLRVEQFVDQLIDRYSRELDRLAAASPVHPDMEDCYAKLVTYRDRLAEFKVFNLVPWKFDFNRFEIIRPLGEGAFGAVFHVTYKGRDMALKVMQDTNPHYAMIDDEIEAMKRLGTKYESPVLKYYGVALSTDKYSTIQSNKPCLLMELGANGCLSKFIEKHSPPLHERIQLLISAAESLKHIHDHGFVHRDLKGENFLVTADGTVKACDFGFARKIDLGVSIGYGSAIFMAPEMMRGSWAVPGPASDVYSFGCVALQVLTGMLPFHEILEQPGWTQSLFFDRVAIDKMRPTIPDDSSIVPPNVRGLIEDCLSHDPAARPGLTAIIAVLQAESEAVLARLDGI